MMKKIVLLCFVSVTLLLTACGKSEFKVNGNTEKHMTITAKNAEKDAFFSVGSLEVDDGEQIVISSDLEKGSIKVEIAGGSETESIDELPELDDEAVITANLVRTDSVSGTVSPGSYQIMATCLEKATGTVEIEVKTAEG